MGLTFTYQFYEIRNFLVPTISFSIGLNTISPWISVLLFLIQILILSIMNIFLPIFSATYSRVILNNGDIIQYKFLYCILTNIFYGILGFIAGNICKYFFQRMPLFYIKYITVITSTDPEEITSSQVVYIGNIITNILHIFFWNIPVIVTQISSQFAYQYPQYWIFGDFSIYFLFIGLWIFLNNLFIPLIDTKSTKGDYYLIAHFHNTLGNTLINFLMLVSILFNKFIPYGIGNYFSIPLSLFLSIIICIIWKIIAPNVVYYVSSIFCKDKRVEFRDFYLKQKFYDFERQERILLRMIKVFYKSGEGFLKLGEGEVVRNLEEEFSDLQK